MVCIMGSEAQLRPPCYTQHRPLIQTQAQDQELVPAPPELYRCHIFLLDYKWAATRLAVCRGLHVQSNQTVILQVGENKIGI